jgi:hypothetical protein
MNIFLLFAILFAGLESLALWKNWLRVEIFAKPAVMIVLFLWLWTSAGLDGAYLLSRR